MLQVDHPILKKLAGMNSDQKKYLKTLVETHGSPGFEERVQEVFRQRVSEACDSVTTDVMGSVTACRNEKGKVKVLLET